MVLAPDEPLSASDRAYDWTRSKILDGSFSDGSMISESDVSEPLGISRTPVREAFLRLEHDGTLKVYPKRGALIIPITAQDMRDVLEARLLIEPWAVAVVARSSGRESLVDTLRSLLDRQQRAAAAEMVLEYQEADRLFHEAIVAATKNRLVDVFYQSLRDRQLRMGAAALAKHHERHGSIVDEHQQIAEAISRGDGESAARIVKIHIGRTRDALDVRG
ncbi:MAG TPA: GntR family transcriptional regulator [Acidimicrobiales bacterium]|nr:GntR family transcriptional regulator [Acidimicrobiales bacterium]